MLQKQKAHVSICNTLGLQGYNSINMHVWKTQLADQWDNLAQEVRIAIIGKYTNLSDSYLSVIKALQHACLAIRRRLKLTWVEAGDIEEQVRLAFSPCCQCCYLHCMLAQLTVSLFRLV
jgi:CTP synthase